MQVAYSAGLAKLPYNSNAEGFALSRRMFVRRIRWDRLIGGGMLYQADPGIVAATPLAALPFMSYLIGKSEEMVQTTRKLWIASRTLLGRKRLDVITIPKSPEGEAVLKEIRSHCPEWSDEPSSLYGIRKAYGLSNASTIVLTLGFIALIGMVLLLLLVAWAFALAGVQWLAVKFWWIVLFGFGFYWVYRKLKKPLS